jgi:putative membrane protein
MWYMHDGGWWVFGAIMMILFWGGLIALVIWGINRTRQGTGGGPTPLEIAKQRYARGEITKEQFEEIKRNI